MMPETPKQNPRHEFVLAAIAEFATTEHEPAIFLDGWFWDLRHPDAKNALNHWRNLAILNRAMSLQHKEWSDKLSAELDLGDSWAWIRNKFMNCGQEFRYVKPRDGRFEGTRYEVMGWLHCIFGDANYKNLAVKICIEQQEKADIAVKRANELEVKIAAWKRFAHLAFDMWDANQDSKCGKLLHALCGLQKGYRADIDALLAEPEGIKA
jgi:hypothetical protein